MNKNSPKLQYGQTKISFINNSKFSFKICRHNKNKMNSNSINSISNNN